MKKPSESPIQVTAQASPNIALIKYWGNQDHELRIPANDSISITLGELLTTTHVQLDPSLSEDHLRINGEPATTQAMSRATALLEFIRQISGKPTYAQITSQNNFPMGAGIASSASAFAALTVAACKAYRLELDLPALSRVARRASGSAARSLCPGFVLLHSSDREDGSFAETIHSEDHWDLVDFIAVVDTGHKAVTSSEGHLLANSSPIQAARVADAPRRIETCRQALQEKDFDLLASVVEQDSNLMHAVMMSSSPPLLYWKPETVSIMLAVEALRKKGLEVCYTIDAGPNVHCICTSASLPGLRAHLESLEILHSTFVCKPGPGARLL